MSKDNLDPIFRTALEDALVALNRADQILDRATDAAPDNSATSPWFAGHLWISRSMCLLIDSLNGVEEADFQDTETIPVARTQNPYPYLVEHFGVRTSQYRDSVW
ncbi:MAG: hypothetical protein OXC14_17260 [Rhodospirillaceae bacterium]|nr:hypothetical protein [Rhodospirillaceae bacterium]